jgi:diaminopimelate epimerase
VTASHRQTGRVQLQKLHGLGNDFLVLVDPAGAWSIDGQLARAVCERRTGVGADGLIHIGPGERMTLLNADGSRAEMSGNGIRCLAHALARSRGVTSIDVDITTDAGIRRVTASATDDATMTATVSMGPIRELPAPDLGLGAKEALGADVGNPHLVALFGDRTALDIAAEGFTRTDRNVEFVMVGPGEDQLTMRVVERGVGETQACGTGACAAAWAGNRWGVVGSHVTVSMPGGDVIVDLGDEAALTGPSVFIADVAWKE